MARHRRMWESELSGVEGGHAIAVRAKGDAAVGKNVSDHLLTMQRQYGNTAVTGVVVQRKGHKTLGAASQDIKDVKPYTPPKEPKAAPTFWPKPNPRFKDSDLKYLTDEALKWAKSTDKNSLSLATEFLDECYLRTKARMWADLNWKSYKALGKQPEADFWLKVVHRELEPPF